MLAVAVVQTPLPGAGGAGDPVSTIAGAPEMSVVDWSGPEGDGGSMAVFSVTLQPRTNHSASVHFATFPGDRTSTTNAPVTQADPTSDYVHTEGDLFFGPGEYQKTIEVPINGDFTIEQDELFKVALSRNSGANLSKGIADGIILNDDAGLDRESSLRVSDWTGPEQGGNSDALFDISLSPPSARPVTVGYRTLEGTARAGSDFSSEDTSVTFAPGETLKRVPVRIIGDPDPEPTEIFYLHLHSPQGARIDGQIDRQLNTNPGTGTIVNDDPFPASASNWAGNEGDQTNPSTAVFTVALSSPHTETTLNFSTAAGTAERDADFENTQGSITFGPQETSKTVSVRIRGDFEWEPDESFYLHITGSSGQPMTDGPATGTIVNDDGDAAGRTCRDPAFQPAVDNHGLPEGNLRTTAVRFQVTSPRAASCDMVVPYATTDGTATAAGKDYVATSGTLSFPAGSTTRFVSVHVNGDIEDEPDETFALQLYLHAPSPQSPGTHPADSKGTATILNDDAPVLSDPLRALRGQLWGYQAKMGGGRIYNYRVTGSDGPSCEPVPTGNGRAMAMDPGDGTLFYSFLSGGLTAQGGGSGDGYIYRTLPPPACTPLGRIPFGDGPAAQPTDGAPGTVRPPFGEPGDEISDSVGALDFDPDDRNLWVSGYVENLNKLYKIHRQSGAVLESCSYPGMPANSPGNNDSLTVARLPGLAGSGKYLLTDGGEYYDNRLMALDEATCKGGRPAVLAATFQVPVAMTGIDFEGGSLIATDLKYIYDLGGPPFNKIHFKNGTDLQVGDASSGMEDISVLTGAGTISNTTVREPAAGTVGAVFTVTADQMPGLAQHAGLSYSTADGTAKQGSDYVATSGTLTFLPGQTEQKVAIAVKADSDVEPDEHFFVQIREPETKNLIALGTGTIVDNVLARQNPKPNTSAGENTGAGNEAGANRALSASVPQVQSPPGSVITPGQSLTHSTSTNANVSRVAEPSIVTEPAGQAIQQSAQVHQSSVNTTAAAAPGREEQKQKELQVEKISRSDKNGRTNLASALMPAASPLTATLFSAIFVLGMQLTRLREPSSRGRSMVICVQPAPGSRESRKKQKRRRRYGAGR